MNENVKKGGKIAAVIAVVIAIIDALLGGKGSTGKM